MQRQSHFKKMLVSLEKEANGFNGSISTDSLREAICVSFLDKGNDSQVADDEANKSCEDAQKQLVVYDPSVNGVGEIYPAPDPISFRPPPLLRYTTSSAPSRVLPSIGAFTVQCAKCFKWRLIPTKEKYEEIREHILDRPFFCKTAREWRPHISCDDPADINQDGSRLWAIDKPNIAQPPPGWQRLLRIRGEGSTKFADVYYLSPSGKRLRSIVEIQKYLVEHPGYAGEGVTLSQFSFQIPRPLQENYVRKRPYRSACDIDNPKISKPLRPDMVTPIAWANPANSTDLLLGGRRLSAPYFQEPVFDPIRRSPKKRAKKPPTCGIN